MAEACMPEMLDVAFALAGENLPTEHRWPLWQALVNALPWLTDEPLAGVHGLRVIESDYGVSLLPRRAKLILRLPLGRARAAAALSGCRLDVAGQGLLVGAHQISPVRGATTLYSDFVITGSVDELDFCRDIEAELATLGVRGRSICGGRRAMRANDHLLTGFALVLHDLSEAHGRLLMQAGLGREHRLGCGILVQHKAITGLA